MQGISVSKSLRVTGLVEHKSDPTFLVLYPVRRFLVVLFSVHMIYEDDGAKTMWGS